MKIETSNIKIQNPKYQIPNIKSQTTPNLYDLRERLLIYARRILNICKFLPKICECEEIKRQLSSAGTSIGANFEEADGALTKKDFINKAGISRKEAKESKYWLRVISGIYIEENQIKSDIKETEEIVNILSAILINSGINKRR